jgi:predicted DCC family thiol-disulfide oxidoreductase YuxK
MRMETNKSSRDTEAVAAKERPFIIFDGHCALCSAGVRWMMLRDPRGDYAFAAVQQPFARAIYERAGLDPDAFDTFMVLIDGRAHLRWEGVLAAARLMPAPWRWLGGAGRIIPDFIGDPIYDFVQRNRLAWFGARDQCFAPDATQRSRFLDHAGEPL